MNAELDADDNDFRRCCEVVCRLTAGRFPSSPGAMLLRPNCLVFCGIWA
jgi:hypothetical protein